MQGKCGLFFTSYSQEDQLFPSKFQKIWLSLFLVVLAFLPNLVDTYLVSVCNLILIAVIGSVALNLLTGFCGQISLGHGAFIGVGAYGTAYAAMNGVPFIAALLLGGLAAAGAGLIFGIPSLRLKGIYLAIATLAAQLILEYVFLHWKGLTGGSNGLVLDSPQIMGFSFDSDQRMYYLILVITVLIVLAASNIVRTRPGRAFMSVRDFYLSAEITGINLFATKLKAFALSSFLAGVSGGLWAYYTMYITPEQFNITLSISYLAMIIIGGLGSILGSIMGAVFITLLPEVLNYIADMGGDFLPGISTHILAMREGTFGLILILFLIFEPEGLVRRWRLLKAYWKLYPFAY